MIPAILTKIHLTRSQKKLLIKAGILCGIFFVFAAGILVPRYVEKSSISEEVTQLAKETLRIQSLVETSQDFGQKLHEILETLKHYKSMIPPQTALAKILDAEYSN